MSAAKDDLLVSTNTKHVGSRSEYASEVIFYAENHCNLGIKSQIVF